ncbi:hypothetical protein, partial [uncultured Faecalibaculum sp.]|uniref:hypothetical protein n=1 Tax=uncultured Faecalibaculum sp. TaxID=1729681 RepID=UPI002711EEBB
DSCSWQFRSLLILLTTWMFLIETCKNSSLGDCLLISTRKHQDIFHEILTGKAQMRTHFNRQNKRTAA